jgi:hypothetical protein
VRVTGIPQETSRGEFDKFVQHLHSLSAQKTGLLSHFRSSRAESYLAARQQEGVVTRTISDDGSERSEGTHLVRPGPTVQLEDIVG